MEDRALGDGGILSFHHCHLTGKGISFPPVEKNVRDMLWWAWFRPREHCGWQHPATHDWNRRGVTPARERDVVIKGRERVPRGQSVWRLCITISSSLGIFQTFPLYLEAYKNILFMFYTNENIVWQGFFFLGSLSRKRCSFTKCWYTFFWSDNENHLINCFFLLTTRKLRAKFNVQLP